MFSYQDRHKYKGVVLAYVLFFISIFFMVLSWFFIKTKFLNLYSLNTLDKYTILYEGLSISRITLARVTKYSSFFISKPINLPQKIRIQFGDRTYEVVIEAEDGKLPVKFPFLKQKFLENLLSTIGFPYEYAKEISAAFVDFQDPDNLKRINGAEERYYKQFGYKPPNRPLLSLQEIIWIKGVTYEIYKELKNYISPYTTDININYANKKVLKAIGFSKEEVDLVLTLRKNKIISLSDLQKILGRNKFNSYIKFLNLLPLPTIYRFKIRELKTHEEFWIILNSKGEVIDVLWF